ncbi:class I SAM-dependent methyltransferase [Micromonospora sp. DR5-3]|uniref:methyltransferase n=1 Tax=unclassified Micromonospora TaxID=2617518 RepID=UPI0011D47AD1|nr:MULTISPECIES: class I SAM-dependent methyltransferase [unclassified Micromonospora]MCW3817406.1 class I SAM-dependent methyltransferase [Micromonospora sp. DR5-3]TYC22915.1 class I SAM-dependent methyltransferase [Micromonospora sp. MP36]
MRAPRTAAQAWDEEYRRGRYQDEPPVAFVADILAAAHGAGATNGLYVGCGNGRNLLPLVDGGLDLLGLDISAEAVRQLADRRPDRAGRLHHGDLDSLPAGATWPLVIGIQVFQHGDCGQAHRQVRAAQRRVAPGGLIRVRVNAVGTDVWPAHEVVERATDDGFTVRYTAGSKRGLDIHFFSRAELDQLFAGWAPVLPARPHRTERDIPGTGQWTQWEAIWQRPAELIGDQPLTG